MKKEKTFNKVINQLMDFPNLKNQLKQNKKFNQLIKKVRNIKSR